MARTYFLRSCNQDGGSYNGFKWPLTVGSTVTAPDWDPKPECGYGLHGLKMGEGDSSLLDFDDFIFLVFSADDGEAVYLDGKWKVREALVEYVGDLQSAAAFLVEHGADPTKCIGHTQTGGDGASLTGGDRATLIGRYDATLTGGDDATLVGGNRATLTGGVWSTLTGGYGATLTGGDGATLMGGDGATLTGGYGATLTGGYGATLTGGNHATLTGGSRSILSGKTGSSFSGGFETTFILVNSGRVYTAIVGKDGIEPNITYKYENGKWEKVSV